MAFDKNFKVIAIENEVLDQHGKPTPGAYFIFDPKKEYDEKLKQDALYEQFKKEFGESAFQLFCVFSHRRKGAEITCPISLRNKTRIRTGRLTFLSSCPCWRT